MELCTKIVEPSSCDEEREQKHKEPCEFGMSEQRAVHRECVQLMQHREPCDEDREQDREPCND